MRGDGAAVRFGWGADGLPDRVRRGAGECAAVRSGRLPPKKNQKMFFAIVNKERANGAYICAKGAVVRVFRADMAISRNRQFFSETPLCGGAE